ncbi:Holliday junction DNA helicase motor protein [Roseobacter sp. MED193]|nr:Holliday junction DNA helicase motor protein [Roseobacter sp. MED193]
MTETRAKDSAQPWAEGFCSAFSLERLVDRAGKGGSK